MAPSTLVRAWDFYFWAFPHLVTCIWVGYSYLGEQIIPRAGLTPAGSAALWAAPRMSNLHPRPFPRKYRKIKAVSRISRHGWNWWVHVATTVPLAHHQPALGFGWKVWMQVDRKRSEGVVYPYWKQIDFSTCTTRSGPGELVSGVVNCKHKAKSGNGGRKSTGTRWMPHNSEGDGYEADFV